MLRGGQWQVPGTQHVQEGDWIRVTLVVQTATPRHFVALTDDVPGGLRPTDLALSAVAGLDLQQVSSIGSGAFRTRKLDPRAPKFYADYLPAGRHEVHYFARVANPGDYLAAPATADATPASRTTSPPKPLAAKPMMSDTLVTRPSLSPKIPARAVPPARPRWSGWSSCSARAVSVMAQSYSRCEVSGRA